MLNARFRKIALMILQNLCDKEELIQSILNNFIAWKDPTCARYYIMQDIFFFYVQHKFRILRAYNGIETGQRELPQRVKSALYNVKTIVSDSESKKIVFIVSGVDDTRHRPHIAFVHVLYVPKNRNIVAHRVRQISIVFLLHRSCHFCPLSLLLYVCLHTLHPMNNEFYRKLFSLNSKKY